MLLDIKGAFDYVLKPKLLVAMQNLKLPLSLINWVESFLFERSIRLSFDNKVQNEKPIEIGVLQRSPISPILCLIYIRDVWQNKAFQLSYMDDFSIATSSTSAKKNCKTLKSVAESLIDKATEKGVQFEPGKTELIHFHSHRQEETEGLTINGHDIKPKSLIQWLGI